MKKLIPLLVTGFIFSNTVLAENTNTPSAVQGIADANKGATQIASDAKTDDNVKIPTPNEEEAVSITPNMRIQAIVQHQVDQKSNYKIDVSYPQITGDKITPQAKQFNQAIITLVKSEIAQFRQSVALDTPHMKTLPADIRSNTFKVDYDVDVVKPRNDTLISVRISFEGMQAGRAHPYHMNRVVNFDLQSGKMLSLNDLFKKNAKFLKLISAYSNKTLNEKLKKDNWMVAQGTKADVKNFKNWNLQADSLLITFDEYQVAPYVYGAQEVEIPYSELKKILASKAPISDCAKDSRACQIG